MTDNQPYRETGQTDVNASYQTARSSASRLTRLRWWLDPKPYAVWRPGNLLLCLVTGHVGIENVNVRSRWETHCAWCQKGLTTR